MLYKSKGFSTGELDLISPAAAVASLISSTLYIGLAFCNRDKEKIQKKATARWVNLETCQSIDNKSLTCTYEKKVGIGKSTSNSNTQSSSYSHAVEFGLTVGTSASLSDPFGVAEVTASMEASMGYSHNWGTESST